MAGIQAIRCYNCNYDSGRFLEPLSQLQEYIKLHPEKKYLWLQALEQFRLCYMARAHVKTYYGEMKSHLSKPSSVLPEHYTNILHKADMTPKTGITEIVGEFTSK